MSHEIKLSFPVSWKYETNWSSFQLVSNETLLRSGYIGNSHLTHELVWIECWLNSIHSIWFWFQISASSYINLLVVCRMCVSNKYICSYRRLRSPLQDTFCVYKNQLYSFTTFILSPKTVLLLCFKLLNVLFFLVSSVSLYICQNKLNEFIQWHGYMTTLIFFPIRTLVIYIYIYMYINT